MTKQTWGKHAAAAAIAILGWSVLMAAQTAAPDPWKRVPPAPASCYIDDDFEAKVDKAVVDIDADIAKQSKLNADIQAKFKAMDGMEKAQRTQAYMMKNPEAAMKMMQAQKAAGATANAQVAASATDGARLDRELAQHKTDFNAAVDRVVKPLEAKQQEMIKTKTRPVGEAGWEFTNPADKAQFAALYQQQNTEYEKVCATFFGPAGTFQAWLADYKSHLIKNVIGAQENIDAALVSQMAIMDTPTGGYRSTAQLEGVKTYVRATGTVYGLRRHKTIAPVSK